MARSTYIYVVTKANSKPINTFTVKHECITWLERTKLKSVNKVLAFRDNALNPEVREFTLEEFMN